MTTRPSRMKRWLKMTILIENENPEFLEYLNTINSEHTNYTDRPNTYWIDGDYPELFKYSQYFLWQKNAISMYYKEGEEYTLVTKSNYRAYQGYVNGEVVYSCLDWTNMVTSKPQPPEF